MWGLEDQAPVIACIVSTLDSLLGAAEGGLPESIFIRNLKVILGTSVTWFNLSDSSTSFASVTSRVASLFGQINDSIYGASPRSRYIVLPLIWIGIERLTVFSFDLQRSVLVSYRLSLSGCRSHCCCSLSFSYRLSQFGMRIFACWATSMGG